jgi:hypothetical protein
MQYLHFACPDSFPAELVDDLPDWPQGMAVCQGSAGMTQCIQDIAGTIGYIDAGHGVAAGLQEIELENKDGTILNTRKAAENNGILAAAESEGVFPDNPDDDFGSVSLLNQPGKYTWPIVQMTYLYVRKNIPAYLEDPREQALLIAFLKALYDEDYSTRCAELYGFTLPTDQVKDFALRGISMLEQELESQAQQRNESVVEWFFEKDTTPVKGAGELVFSVKRQLISDLERDELIATVETLTLTTELLEQAIEELQSEIEDTGGRLATIGVTASENDGSNEFTDKDAQQLKAALALSIISFLFWIGFFIFYLYRCMTVK